MIYDFHPAAKQELNDTVNYYDNINPDLGDAFLDEFDRTLDRIQRFPKAWSLLSANTRYCRMGRFPYSIIYRNSRGRNTFNCGSDALATQTPLLGKSTLIFLVVSMKTNVLSIQL
ncbi:type II toxin-antitoxin system RelE/ParE family toxin [Laspinema palackyanum]|uniref:type II toxin-antitoxin system RelE/ParE family toxin n=1 Tax=Laspinema palackyanum TaxID=3231601 RepID=UPI00345CC2F3|nr:type II toxin-antitoxin system RelE/ParE family toxin [Laspinema sp. D2c]